MKERLTELQERVHSAREALEALAERTAELRGRVEAARPEDPPFASVPAAGVEGNGPSFPYRSRDPFMPIGPGGPLVTSLERLTQMSPLSQRTFSVTAHDLGEGDDGRLVSDAWEIALINEEGK
jgi:hypothetical protein